MNSLAETYGDKLQILAFPCDQFGHQAPGSHEEFMASLKLVRPGDDFALADQVMVFEKCNCNGKNQLPLFQWLKMQQMVPSGDADGDVESLEDKVGNGCADVDALVLPRDSEDGSMVVTWAPLTRSDIAWNFEKFLIGPDGDFIRRYSRYMPTVDIAKDIDTVLPKAD